MVKKTLIFIAGVLCLLVASLSYDIYRHLAVPLDYSPIDHFEFAAGSSVRQLAKALHARGVIKRPRYFELYARLRGLDARLQAGDYKIKSGLSGIDILNMLHQGDVQLQSFTLIEGWTFKQLRAALAKESTLSQTISIQLSDAEVMAALGYPNQHPEGRFYPDTYLYARGTTDIAFLQRAYQKMQQLLTQQWQQRSDNLPLKNSYEALILASIVERESAIAKERPLVAAVFINRLNKGMRLQTDPTVIYGMGDDYDGDIRFRDLRRDTPYNTYMRSGLTPTPIAMPSEAAIYATLHPVKSDALYFVARNSGDGSHHFSNTLSEHNAAVDRYQRKR